MKFRMKGAWTMPCTQRILNRTNSSFCFPFPVSLAVLAWNGGLINQGLYLILENSWLLKVQVWGTETSLTDFLRGFSFLQSPLNTLSSQLVSGMHLICASFCSLHSQVLAGCLCVLLSAEIKRVSREPGETESKLKPIPLFHINLEAEISQ